MTEDEKVKFRASLRGGDIRRAAEEVQRLKEQLRDAILDHDVKLMEQVARELVGLPRQSTQ